MKAKACKGSQTSLTFIQASSKILSTDNKHIVPVFAPFLQLTSDGLLVLFIAIIFVLINANLHLILSIFIEKRAFITFRKLY
jgi:hypothetical protein